MFKLGFTEGFPMGNTVAGTMKLINNTFVYLTPVNCSCVGLLQEKQWVLKLYYTKVLKRRRKVSNLNILKYQINYINWGYTRKTLMGRLRGRGFKEKKIEKSTFPCFNYLYYHFGMWTWQIYYIKQNVQNQHFLLRIKSIYSIGRYY